MARPNSPDMPQKRTFKVRLGIKISYFVHRGVCVCVCVCVCDLALLWTLPLPSDMRDDKGKENFQLIILDYRYFFSNEGWSGLMDEIDMEVKRISKRNLGRDDRYALFLFIHVYCKLSIVKVEQNIVICHWRADN